MGTPVEDYIWEMKQFRHQKDQFFATSPDSPIPPTERQNFQGLRYFEPDLSFRVEAALTYFPEPEEVTLGTTSGQLRQYYRAGEARFRLEGQECRLTFYKSVPPPEHHHHGEHHHHHHEEDTSLFLPFRDATSGKESYGAGRYLEVEAESACDGRLVIDFNLAYSPWCAYNEAYTCVLPPEENRLSVALRAGERSYH